MSSTDEDSGNYGMFLSVVEHHLSHPCRLPKNPPLPPPLSLDDAKVGLCAGCTRRAPDIPYNQTTPLASASLFSCMTFSWVTDFMVLGYQRTLQAPDLYKLDVSRKAGSLAEKLEAAWARRIDVAAEWNANLEKGEIYPSALRRRMWDIRAIRMDETSRGRTYRERRAALEAHWKMVGGRKKPSLAWALNDVFGWSFWLGGILNVCAFFLCDTTLIYAIQTGDCWRFPDDGTTSP